MCAAADHEWCLVLVGAAGPCGVVLDMNHSSNKVLGWPWVYVTGGVYKQSAMAMPWWARSHWSGRISTLGHVGHASLTSWR